ncbi:hypothetical protein [Zunongwangia sp. H14]|uniref:hypothetical protein n=1 Tax=Zunongwangia sp. H14 TaxID=3240792 RepID=UPI00356625A1
MNVNDGISGIINHNGEVIQIKLDINYPKISGFIKNLKNLVFEIDYAEFGNVLRIYLIKVYTKENEELGTKAIAYFEDWGRKAGFKKIVGELVDCRDSSNPVKLKNFYLKNQYCIEDTDDDYIYANISKSLI